MKLSTKGTYGLRALIDIAANSQTDPVSISSISTRQAMSVGYLEQLISKLKRSGFVNSVRGVRGGYVLAKPASEISVGDVLRALEGSLSPVDCPAAKDEGEGCDESGSCLTKVVWQKINDSINIAVDAIKLSEIIEEAKTSCSI
ncbi:MAG: Rrf2 family transcriptional regulator [Eubacteriaceae bacterium]|nr:Rrf2 family transcriptional regulator [Eubacteriaceae bacterium]